MGSFLAQARLKHLLRQTALADSPVIRSMSPWGQTDLGLRASSAAHSPSDLKQGLVPPAPQFIQESLLTKVEASPLALFLEEVAAGPGMHIGPILHQELHTLQAPLLDGNMKGTVASVVLICALGIDQGLGIARVPVDLKQWQDAGVGPIPKVQHGLHQARLAGGALCGRRGGEGAPGCSGVAQERLGFPPACTVSPGSKVPLGRIKKDCQT